MKASDMTNEMLAHNLEATVPFLMEEARHLTDADEIMTEAAARLRKMDAVAMALNIEVGMNKAAAKITVALSDKLKAAEDALEKSPCGEVYQLGLVDDDGNCYNGIAIKFDESEGLKLSTVGCGDRFVVVPYSALAAIREEEGAK